MHRWFAADDVDRLYAGRAQTVEHGAAICEAHVRNIGHGSVEAESAGAIAPHRGIELYVVRSGSHKDFSTPDKRRSTQIFDMQILSGDCW